MNNFNNPEQSYCFPCGQARRHHDHHSPTGEGEFSGPGDERGSDFPEGSGHGPHDRHGHGFGFGPGFPPGFSGGFGPGFGGFSGGFGPGFGGFGGGFGPGFGPGFRGGMGRAGRVRKGNVRSAILSLLSRHSYNGYGLIGAIATHTDGAWRPSPGSIYPALAALQAEGLIASVGNGKRTEFELTDAGRSYVADHAEEMAQVWTEAHDEASVSAELRTSMGKLIGAVQQIGLGGSEEQIKAATEALDAARRTVYKLLSD